MLFFLKKKILQSFYDVEITSFEIFLQRKVLILIMRRWMPLWNCCEMFIVFSSVTERTERLYLPIWASDLNGKTLSLHRKKLALFHDAPIHLFLKGKHFFLIACNPELIVRWLASSAVFRSVTTRTVKSVNITECASGYRLEITKGEKVRTQLCIECVSNAYRMRMSN